MSPPGNTYRSPNETRWGMATTRLVRRGKLALRQSHNKTQSTWNVENSPAAFNSVTGGAETHSQHQSPAVNMTTLNLIDLTCPVCEMEFRSQTVVATNGYGGKRTDFHERAAGMQPLPYFVHLCTHCGYAGVARDFGDGVEPSDLLKEQVWSELAPALQSSLPSGSLKYEHAAKVAAWQGNDARYLADLYLRAAWCCVDEGDTEAERYFRRLAAWRFADALDAYDVVPAAERAVITYLIGELWRRIGDHEKADHWFARVADEVTEPVAQSWVLEVAEQQRVQPREWFT